MYRKEGLPFHTNIKNVGVEGYFYSADENDADDAITIAEGEFSLIIDDLRSGNEGALRDPARIGELLAHLETRTRHARRSYLSAGTHIADAFFEMMSDPDQLGSFLRRTIREDPSFLRDALSKELEKHGLHQKLLPEVMKRAGPLVDLVLPSVTAQVSSFAMGFRSNLPATMGRAAKLSHIRALEQNVAPTAKAQVFSKFRFHVARQPGTSLLLGDSLVLFHTNGPRTFKALFDKADDLQAIILPISSDSVLVGAGNGYRLDFDRLPLEVARCSLECFIASEESDRNLELRAAIGENAHLLSESELREILKQFLNGP